jgi:predicted metalloprotease with PDZ domain
VCLLSGIAFAQGDGDTISYAVSLAHRAEHLVHVSVRVPKAAQASHELVLPVWNALYQVRDFSQYVMRFSAHDDAGKPLPARVIDKTTWRVESTAPFVFEYDIVADDAGPFGAQLNDEHAFFNLAEILVYERDWRNEPMLLNLSDVPQDWKIATALSEKTLSRGSREVQTFAAKNYDHLVDSPIEIGTFALQTFDEGGAHYQVLVHADPSDYDLNAITAQAHKLAATEGEWMNDRPFDHYLFIYHFRRGPAGGGMEHAYSTAIDSSAQRVKQDPQAVAGVTAHEFFHLWNVKRIRPQSLEPIDYTKEQYSRALWWSEGVTSTVGDLMLVRAGYWDEQRYIDAIGRVIASVDNRPAHLAQSAEESSLETWYDKYPFYGQPNRSISYYSKGELLGILLDLTVRDATGNKKSLRDIFHWLNDNYAKKGRFFPDSAGIEQASEAVCGCALKQFFTDYVSGTAALDYDKYLRFVGLRVNKTTTTVPDPGFRIGRTFGQPSGLPTPVTEVDPHSPPAQAGLKVGDVIQQVNGSPLSGPLQSQFNSLHVGDEVRLTLAGGRGITFKLAGKPQDNYALVDLDNVSAEQRSHRAAWVRGD